MYKDSESRCFSREIILTSVPELKNTSDLSSLSIQRLHEIIGTLDAFGNMSPDMKSAQQLIMFRGKVSAALTQKTTQESVQNNEDSQGSSVL